MVNSSEAVSTTSTSLDFRYTVVVAKQRQTLCLAGDAGRLLEYISRPWPGFSLNVAETSLYDCNQYGYHTNCYHSSTRYANIFCAVNVQYMLKAQF